MSFQTATIRSARGLNVSSVLRPLNLPTRINTGILRAPHKYGSQWVSPLSHYNKRLSFQSKMYSSQIQSSHKETESDNLELTEDQYNHVSEHTLTYLLDTIEESLLQTDIPVDEYELDYFMGVLTIKLPFGTYVLNKQPPNKEIWLSSPISGPKRFKFNFENDSWTYTRTGDVLETLLQDELTQYLKWSFILDPQGFKTSSYSN